MIERVERSVPSRDDDLRFSVAVDVADGGRRSDRLARDVGADRAGRVRLITGRRRIRRNSRVRDRGVEPVDEHGANGEARRLRGHARLHRVDVERSVRRAEDDVAHAVAVDVRELRAFFRGRSEIDREAGEEIRVGAVLIVGDRNRAAHVAALIERAVVRGRADAQRDGLVVRSPAVRVIPIADGLRVGIGRVLRVDRARVERGERRVRAAAHRGARDVRHRRDERLELRVVGLDAGRPLDDVVVRFCALRSDGPDDRDGSVHARRVNRLVPSGRRHVDLGRNLSRLHHRHRFERVLATVVEALIPTGFALVELRAGAGVVRRDARLGYVDVVGALFEHLHHFFRGERQRLREREAHRVDEARDARGASRRFARAARSGDAERAVPAVVGARVEREERRRAVEAVAVESHRVDRERVVPRRRLVVVARVFVGHARVDHHAVAVRVVDRRARERRVVDRAERFLNDLHAIVRRVDDGLAEVVHVGDEALADAKRNEHAVRARADSAHAVVALRGRVVRFARAVAVARVVVRVVVVLVEVPTRDVVDVAVTVVVFAVGEHLDEIARVEDAVPVAIARLAIRRVRRRVHRVHVREALLARDDGREARIVCVVGDVEDAVAVAVVTVQARARVPAAVLRLRRAGELALIERDFVRRVGVVPFVTRVEDRDVHLWDARRQRPRFVDAHARRAERDVRAEIRLRADVLLRQERPVIPPARKIRIVRLIRRIGHVVAGRRGRPRRARAVRREREDERTRGSYEPSHSEGGPKKSVSHETPRIRRTNLGCACRARERCDRATRSTRRIRRARSAREARRSSPCGATSA